MTEKLYYDNAYTRRFDARVLSCVRTAAGYEIVLDRTAFFPEEGGQYSDTGTLADARITHVSECDGRIVHLSDRPLPVGASVVGVIDFDERYEKMQCHTAEHILSGLFHKYYGLDNVGFHLGADDVTMDISAPLDRADLDRVESLANGIIYEDVPVRAIFPDADTLAGMTYRAKLDLRENVRIVLIGEYDACACCAPHVATTGEIGVVKIFDTEKLRGGMRLHISAGRRALRIFDRLYKNAVRMSALLSAPRDELPSALDDLLRNFTRTRSEFDAFRIDTYIGRARASLDTKNKNAVIFLDGARPAELREVANALSGEIDGTLVLLSGTDGAICYVVYGDDPTAVVKKANAALCGRGGGKGNMAQGGFSTTLDAVKEYFSVEFQDYA